MEDQHKIKRLVSQATFFFQVLKTILSEKKNVEWGFMLHKT